MVINPRGIGGSGKTELVRRILADYGWRRGSDIGSWIRPICRAERRWPLAYRLEHPAEGRPLLVLGHYEVTSGGCDTIRASDGGLGAILKQAGAYAAAGHDVLIEGNRLSSDVEHSWDLARAHRLHILRLDTPVEQCVRNLVARRRVGRSAAAPIERAAAVERRTVDEACRLLEAHATVEVLPFGGALARVRDLLGIRASARTEMRSERV